MPFPVAIGAASANLDVPDRTVAGLYLNSFATAIVLAGVRLIPLGQTEGHTILHRLAPLIARVAEHATEADLDDIGGCVFHADMASMLHETMEVRLFKT